MHLQDTAVVNAPAPARAPIPNKRARVTRSCERCGELFTTWPSRIARGHGRFCSLVCINRLPAQGGIFRDDGTVLIPLGPDTFAIIDAADADSVIGYRWYLTTSGYAARSRLVSDPPGTVNTVLMHRELLGAVAGEEVDHINRRPLDNRRDNLRKATSKQNKANQGVGQRNRSGFRGVSRVKKSGNWRATIKTDGRQKYLGEYPTAEEAAKAYDAAAAEIFGAFAVLNFGAGCQFCSKPVLPEQAHETFSGSHDDCIRCENARLMRVWSKAHYHDTQHEPGYRSHWGPADIRALDRDTPEGQAELQRRAERKLAAARVERDGDLVAELAMLLGAA